MEQTKNIPLGEIAPSPANPRKTHAAIDELAASIEKQGLLQPLRVRPVTGSGFAGMYTLADMDIKYEIVCGERRYRALKQLASEHGKDNRWQTAPCIVCELDDDAAYLAMVTENLQREDVEPMEEAAAYALLADKGHTAEDIAARLGKSARFVSDRIRLHHLIPDLAEMVRDGRIGIAAALDLAKLDTGTQEDFLGFHSAAAHISRADVRGFIDRQFDTLERAIWSKSDPDYTGGCRRACKDCMKNTANAGCLFADMIASAECTDHNAFISKSLAFLLDRLKGEDVLKEGEAITGGKTVLIDTCRPYNARGRAVHDDTTNAIKEAGYAIVNPSEVLGSPCWERREDRLAEMIACGEIVKCVDILSAGTPSYHITYYYTLPAEKQEGSARETDSERARQIVESLNATTAKIDRTACESYAAIAKSHTICDDCSETDEAETRAFDILVLSQLPTGFFQEHYGICKDHAFQRPEPEEVETIADNYQQHRRMWQREYIRKTIAEGCVFNRFAESAALSVLPLWKGEEFRETYSKSVSDICKAQDKARRKLDALGYGLDGKAKEEPQDDGKSRYAAAKKKHPDAVPLFRHDGFYETYEADAEKISEILGLAKTKRAGVTMCGFPDAAIETYLPKLVRNGCRVAIIEKQKQ